MTYQSFIDNVFKFTTTVSTGCSVKIWN